jgi:hypothetical protein
MPSASEVSPAFCRLCRRPRALLSGLSALPQICIGTSGASGSSCDRGKANRIVSGALLSDAISSEIASSSAETRSVRACFKARAGASSKSTRRSLRLLRVQRHVLSPDNGITVDSMLSVYLDQKDWIALLKAQAGKPERPAHADALTLLGAAVEAGQVSLPLSHVHYQETSHRKPFAKRVELHGRTTFRPVDTDQLSSPRRRKPGVPLTCDSSRRFATAPAPRSLPLAKPAPPRAPLARRRRAACARAAS